MESLSVGPLLAWLTLYLLTHVERMCWVFLCAQNLLSKDLSDKKIGMASHSSSWPSDPFGRLFQSPSPAGFWRFPNSPGLYWKYKLSSHCCWGGTSLFSTGSENWFLKSLVSVWPIPSGSVLHCTEAFTVCVTVSHWFNKKLCTFSCDQHNGISVRVVNWFLLGSKCFW